MTTVVDAIGWGLLGAWAFARLSMRLRPREQPLLLLIAGPVLITGWVLEHR